MQFVQDISKYTTYKIVLLEHLMEWNHRNVHLLNFQTTLFTVDEASQNWR